MSGSLIIGFVRTAAKLGVSQEVITPFLNRVAISSEKPRIRNFRGFAAMATASLSPDVKAKLDQVADVKIDESGKFKYILIKVFAEDGEGKHVDTNSKVVVRGRADCGFHADIYDRFHEEISKLQGLDDEILGGGRILREGNKITVFGYSQGYGRADHALAVEVLKKQFPTHDLNWSNDGY